MRGTIAKELFEAARTECPYPSAHETLHVGTRGVNIADPGKRPHIVPVDCFVVRCVGLRKVYLELKKAYRAEKRPSVDREKLQSILDDECDRRERSERRSEKKAAARRRWRKIKAKILDGEERRLTKDEVKLAQARMAEVSS